MPKMASKASDASLRAAVEEHLKETDAQINRLEQVFKTMGKPPQAVPCATIDGLIKEASDVVNHLTDKHLLDAALIAAEAGAVVVLPGAEDPGAGLLLAAAPGVAAQAMEALRAVGGWTPLP
jgi:hypothetical protein